MFDGLGYRVTKRALDATASSVALLFLTPTMVAIAIAVRLDSPGSCFFGHERVGRDGKRFKVWKFRTMRDGAGGPSVTVHGDARITRVGRLLRKSKLDELPQLWNVLAGDMSLVGPRPEVPEYVELFASDYAEVLTVRPGITDEASIVYRWEEELLARSSDPARSYAEEILPRKLALSKAYVQAPSLRGDLRILWRTLSAVAGFGRQHV